MKTNFAFVGLVLLVVTTWQCGQSEAEMKVASQTETLVHQHTNHLINETSPYLLQHAHNPVDWYPWSDEALDLARTQNKPIFLSIGYSACHWCHVMERESFENEVIASILNEFFISIKVDREQRPDLDEIYMSFTTAITGHGGWPMSVFLTPDLKPFYAGTYFPPDDRGGRPGFKRLLTEIGKAWTEQQDKIVASSQNIFQQVTKRIQPSIQPGTLNRQMIKQTADALMLSVDKVNGGFGRSPKFPHAIELSMFLRYYEQSGDSAFLQAAELSLKAMSRGGIFDQIGGGFARYSTDEKWLVPHFEKMLYDNSLLVPVYVDAFRITGDKEYLDTVRRTLDFMLREMVSDEGGFYSALDADSEGEEGKFYLWDRREVEQVLGDKAQPFIDYHNITYKGNFEHRNIPNLTTRSIAALDKTKYDNDEEFDSYLAYCRALLLSKRAERIRPATDDKILTSWNGMALSALCKGYQATGDKRYLDAATKNAHFVQTKLFRNSKLTHAYREGKHSNGEFLEDYAFYISGLLDLYESDPNGNETWLKFAVTLANQATDMFMDDNHRLYLRPADQADLIYRPQMEADGAIPAAGSFLFSSLIKLNRITGNQKFLTQAEVGLQALVELIKTAPGSVSSVVCAIDYLLGDKIEIVVVGRGDVRDEMLGLVYANYQPNRILAMSENGNSGVLFEGRTINGNDANNVRAYVCINSTCKLPASTPEELQRQLEEL